MSKTPIRLTLADPKDHSRLVVEWILSSVCNFSCTYCPASLHDGRVRWPDYADISRFCRAVRDHYPAHDVTFLLSGGEITLYPHLARLARELHELSVETAILSNGTRPSDWWREHVALFDEVLLSFHHERGEPDRFIEVVKILDGLTRVQVNVVIDPAAFEKTMSLATRVESETSALAHRKIMFLDGWRRPADYTEAQHLELSAALAGEARLSAQVSESSLLKGDLNVDFADGSRERLTPLQIIDTGLNSWADWTCSVGVETLFVRFDEIWRASCREGGRVGSIFDSQWDLPDAGVRCTARSCNCIAGIKASKFDPLLTAGR